MLQGAIFLLLLLLADAAAAAARRRYDFNDNLISEIGH
jgi:hypothetical protein